MSAAAIAWVYLVVAALAGALAGWGLRDWFSRRQQRHQMRSPRDLAASDTDHWLGDMHTADAERIERESRAALHAAASPPQSHRQQKRDRMAHLRKPLKPSYDSRRGGREV